MKMNGKSSFLYENYGSWRGGPCRGHLLRRSTVGTFTPRISLKRAEVKGGKQVYAGREPSRVRRAEVGLGD